MFVALKTHPWAYPTLEAVHLVAIAVLVGNLIAFEARVWGAAHNINLRDLAKLSLTLAVGGFMVAAMTGLLMFSTQAEELLANRAFLTKMVLISVAGLNAAWFHARGALQKMDRLARAQTFVSAMIWVGAIFAGRWIAYV